MKTPFEIIDQTPRNVKIEYNNATHTLKVNDLERSMKACGISIEEAIELWLEEEGYIEPDEEYAQNLNAPKPKVRGENKTTKTRKKPTRKEDPLKQELIQTIAGSLNQNPTEITQITIRNNEKFIDFVLNGEEYTINLVKHRKKK